VTERFAVREILVCVPPVKAQPKIRKIKLLLLDSSFVYLNDGNVDLIVQRVQLQSHVAVQLSNLVHELVRHLDLRGVVEPDDLRKVRHRFGFAQKLGVKRPFVASKGLVRIERVGFKRLGKACAHNTFEIDFFMKPERKLKHFN
jgi:hypothetical protein